LHLSFNATSILGWGRRVWERRRKKNEDRARANEQKSHTEDT
jgi:hypothetical protein